MNYEERQKAICEQCNENASCPYIPREMEYKCQNISDTMYGWELGYKDASTNICDWLKHHLDCYVEVEGEHAFTTDLKIHTDLIIEDLKKYLEEQQ